MLFSSLSFLFVFLPCVLLINHLLKEEYRNYFLLLSSIVFYAWGEPKFVFVMLVSIGMNYLFGLTLDWNKLPRKAVLCAAVIMNLGILFVFKYLNFTASNLDKIFTGLIPQFDIVLPIGISFFTFQAMSYVIDVYRGQAKAQKNPFFLGLYIALFPQLIAGPIVRYTEIEKQIVSRTVTPDSFGDGVRRFMIGFSKKVIIANNIAFIADWSFASVQDGTASVICTWLGAVAYALQIYFDFGGYSDMAIGLGRMLGFHFQENFIYPYSKASMKGFWSENHVSLCNWFRDYIYIPLGGSRGSVLKTIRNLFIVWAVTGIWHGADWVFLFWGLIYFVILVIEKYAHLPDRFHSRAPKVLYRCFTLVMLVILNGVLFRDVGRAGTLTYLGTMFGFVDAPIFTEEVVFYCSEYGIFLLLAIVYATSVFRYLKNRIIERGEHLELFSAGACVVYVIAFLIGVSYLVLGSYNPFIYFNF